MTVSPVKIEIETKYDYAYMNKKYSILPFKFGFSQKPGQIFDFKRYKFKTAVTVNDSIKQSYANDWTYVGNIPTLWAPSVDLREISTNEKNIVLVACFSITCDFEPSIKSKFSNPATANRDITSNYAIVLSNAIPDFTFVVKGKKIKVHKKLLAAASPVFALLFVSNMQESHANLCKIDKITPKIFKHLIDFIYVAKLPDDFEDVTKELFEAAHYYELIRLKEICVQELKYQLSLENAIEIYSLANTFDLNELKKDAWHIIKR